MKKTVLIFFAFFPVAVFAQQQTVMKIEELSKPGALLGVSSGDAIYERLILSDADLSPNEAVDIPFNILAKSKTPAGLVNFGYHSFFYGMYQAYADHRPFVLSPDMIWLLISQGFARHVNANSEKLRYKFVNFDKKVTLIVLTDKISIRNSTCNNSSLWEEIFPQFTQKIGEHTGQELMDVLSCDFSTTTAVEKVASEITIMEAMKSYFEYVVMTAVCGIPEITLKGTTEDWEKILEKAKKLRQYDLDWWMAEIEPVLEEFVKASKGKIKKDFWRNMFKYHTEKIYGSPKTIDGWIVKFFPYDKDGNRNNLKSLTGAHNLPDEIVKVDFKFQEVFDNGVFVDTPMEFWAGFIGLEQDEKTFALSPQIAWMIRKKDEKNAVLIQKLEAENNTDWGISIRVKEFPKELLSLKVINRISIEFTDNIDIPDEFKNVEVRELELRGQIEPAEIARIKNMFPNSRIIINHDIIANGI
ncbi:MAG: DUF4419 domain-containing protein [Prevotellaceae bacterium]|jgi:hypothetical protein|nr:DUF4419 domain-containing protein [Prevotellaceae bacterium]